ncbi:MAG TPA: hypothetical protein VKQ54_04085 [Caulobacteraceae bacterium]|nr:hypothetical protein [Caulobacteraceae bacterium]
MTDRLGSSGPLESPGSEFESESPIGATLPRFRTRGAVFFPEGVIVSARAWRRSPSRHVYAILVALSFLTLLAPLLLVEIPPLTDYPNHLARYWLIAGGLREPALAPFYRIDWFNAVTNVGVDRMVSFLSPLVPGMRLGHIALAAAAVLPPLGVLALNYAVTRRITAWQALFPLAAWSTTFLMGFLNFQIGLGLALLFAALDPLAQPGLWSILQRRGAGWAVGAIRVPLGLILAADHLFGLLFYAVLLAGLGMGPEPLVVRNWRALLLRLRRAALAAAWCLIPLAITATHKALPGSQGAAQSFDHSIQYNVMPGKLATLFSVLASYNVFQEMVLAGALVALIVGLNRSRALTAHTGLVVAFAGLVALAILAPSRAAGASWIDRRFPIMALFCVLAALQLRKGVSPRFALAFGGAALGLACLQSAWVGWNWLAMERDMRAVRQVLAAVPAGATILPLQHDPSLDLKWRAPAGRYMFGVGDATFRHFDALAVPLRHAFVPNLFAARGLQPLKVLGDWDRVVEHNGGDLASVSALGRPPLPEEASYIPGWRTRFDYVLVLNADMPDQAGPFRPPPELTLVSTTRFAQLWRVARPGRR